MGQVPYWFGTPDGYPDDEEKWARALMPRWGWASRLMGYELASNKPDLQTLKGLMAFAPQGSSKAVQVDFVLTGGNTDPAYIAWVQAYIDGQQSNPNVVLREAFALIAQGPSFQYYE